MAEQLKLWQNKKVRNLFEMPTQNDVFSKLPPLKKTSFLVGISNKFPSFLFC